LGIDPTILEDLEKNERGYKNKMIELRTKLTELSNNNFPDVTPEDYKELYKLIDPINAANLVYENYNGIVLLSDAGAMASLENRMNRRDLGK